MGGERVAVRPVRPLQEKRGWAFAVAAGIVRPTLLAFTKHTWIDTEKIPATGGCILVFNHVSHADPLTAAHIVYDNGRLPRYLAKSGLFKNKALSYFLRSAGQIPVERQSKNAKGAFDAAVAAVREGECVVVYPEGTLTRDPDLWPMAGKTGAARIALETGCPVIPIGQWGAHDLLYPYAKKPHLFPRTQITMKVGDPVVLDDLIPQPRTAQVINEATTRIMDALTHLVEGLRNEKAPAVRYDPGAAGMPPIGRPGRKDAS